MIQIIDVPPIAITYIYMCWIRIISQKITEKCDLTEIQFNNSL
jgi:hypothetical protein